MSTAGKTERDEAGGGESPKPGTIHETRDESFDCSAAGCVVSDCAAEMFNTSCDPTKITLDELKKKVLCMACAVRHARRTGKDVSRKTDAEDGGPPRFSKRDITAAGSSLYSLAQTLRAMRSLSTAAAGTPDDGIYACMERGCNASGPAGEMFNRPCDMASTGMRELLALVCCRDHAETIAAKRGMRPGEAGSGVYLFAATLRRVRMRTGFAVPPAGPSSRELHELNYLQWYMRRPVARYAEQMAADRRSGDDGFSPPTTILSENGGYRCGLSVSCCDHEGPAERFLAISGETIGLCALAAQVFSETAEGMDRDDLRRYRILPAESPEQAALVAAHSTGRHEDARSPDCRACTQPKAQRSEER